jgi:hypothetical protein
MVTGEFFFSFCCNELDLRAQEGRLEGYIGMNNLSSPVQEKREGIQCMNGATRVTWRKGRGQERFAIRLLYKK